MAVYPPNAPKNLKGKPVEDPKNIQVGSPHEWMEEVPELSFDPMGFGPRAECLKRCQKTFGCNFVAHAVRPKSKLNDKVDRNKPHGPYLFWCAMYSRCPFVKKWEKNENNEKTLVTNNTELDQIEKKMYQNTPENWPGWLKIADQISAIQL